MKRIFFFIMIIILSIGLASITSAQGLKKVKTAYSALIGSQAPPWIAKETGIFERNGLSVDLIYIASASKIAQSLIGRDIEIAQTGGGGTISAALGGAEIVMIAGTHIQFVFSLMVTPEIKNINDLKGKAIGVSRFGGNTHFAAIKVLEENGLQPNKDVAILQMGGEPEVFGGIKNRSIHGGIIGPPHTLLARKMGLKELIDIGAMKIPFPATVIAVTRSYLRQNEDTVKRYVMSIIEAIYTYKTQKDLSIKILSKYLRTNDREVLEETQSIYAKYLATVPYPPIEGINAVLKSLSDRIPKALTAKPEEFIDTKIIRELDESGFILKTYKGKI